MHTVSISGKKEEKMSEEKLAEQKKALTQLKQLIEEAEEAEREKHQTNAYMRQHHSFDYISMKTTSFCACFGGMPAKINLKGRFFIDEENAFFTTITGIIEHMDIEHIILENNGKYSLFHMSEIFSIETIPEKLEKPEKEE